MKKFIILMMLLAASLRSYAFVIKINGGGNEKSATLTQLGSKRLRCSWTEIPGATTYKIWLLSFRTNYEHVLASRTVHVVDTTKMGIIFKSKGNLAIRGNQYFCTVEAKSESFWFGEQWSSRISLTSDTSICNSKAQKGSLHDAAPAYNSARTRCDEKGCTVYCSGNYHPTKHPKWEAVIASCEVSGCEIVWKWKDTCSPTTKNVPAPPPDEFLKTLLNYWILVVVVLSIIIVAFIAYMCNCFRTKATGTHPYQIVGK
eukprot:487751_1